MTSVKKDVRIEERRERLVDAEMRNLVRERDESQRRRKQRSLVRRQISAITCDALEKMTHPETRQTIQMFVIYVTWKDETVNVVYRTYQAFARLQKSLVKIVKKAKEGKKTYGLPTLPYLYKLGLGLREKDKEKTIRERVQLIDEYCKCVASLPQSTLDSAHVHSFFKPTEIDIELTAKPKSSLNGASAGVTSPTMSKEQYSVACDFTPEASDQVELVEGTTVSVLVKRDLGWWLVVTEEGTQGWVPATHLQSELEEQEDLVVRYPKGMEEQFLVVKNYRSDLQDELSLEMGTVVEVVEKTMDGWWLIRSKGREGRVPATNMRRANTAKAQQILDISSQVTLEAQIRETKSSSKSPPKLSSRRSKKKPKPEPHHSQRTQHGHHSDRKSKTLPDVVPSQPDPYEEVLPPPPRRQHSKKRKRQGALKRRTPSTREVDPLQQEEFRSLQMLESVISLSEADNTNNNASAVDEAGMTRDDPRDGARDGAPPSHFVKNPHRPPRSTRHIKAKPTTAEQDTSTTPKQSHRNALSQRSRDGTDESLTLARKEGRPIYVARASYRACDDTEVDLIADELVVVLEKSGEGWWYVQAKNGSGWAPNHFLKVPTGLMDENPQVAEEKQMQHLEQLRPLFVKSTCSAADQQDQHAPKHTVRHVIRGRPTLFRDGAPATLPPPTKSHVNDADDDIGKSVSDLRRKFDGVM